MKGLDMTITVNYQPTKDVLAKIRESIAVHSRFSKKHTESCAPCHEDYLDFVEQSAIDQQEDC